MHSLWLLFAAIFCLRRADASQIRGSLKQRPLASLPHSETLRSLSAQPRGEATGKAVSLLRSISSAGKAPRRGGDKAELAPFVVAIGRPLHRLALRELLGCDANLSDITNQKEDTALNVNESKGAPDVVDGILEPPWRQLCSAASFGLERLHSGAVLLTVELPSAVHGYGRDRGSRTEQGTGSERYTQGLRDSESPSGENGPEYSRLRATRGEAHDYKVPPVYLPGKRGALTEAAMVKRVALTLVEAADILVIPVFCDEPSPSSLSLKSSELHSLGELVCMRSSANGTEGRSAKPGTSRSTEKSPPQLQTESKPVNAQLRLPEDVLQLLQAMRQLTNEGINQEGASCTTRQSRIHPTSSAVSLYPETRRPRRLPLVVIALEGPVSPSKQEAIRAEVSAQLGTAEAKVKVIGVQPHGGKDTRDEIDRLIQGIQPRNASMEHIADALAAFLTRQHASGPPNALEFAPSALSSNVCAAAFRLCLAEARKGLHHFQRPSPQNASRQSFGSMAQGVLSDALTLYDYRTRRYQLSLQRRALREELMRSIEREIRTIFLREALQIESNLRMSLRAELVAALQKDARRFESLAPAIIRKALTILDERLTRLLPSEYLKQSVESLPFKHTMPTTSREQPILAKASDASAKAGRDSQLCRNFYRSLFEIHFLLLQKSARGFSVMATELSRSPLAALLRQQHGRPWLGLSVRPLLSIASLLRMRGTGNLQGYSRYNAGPIQFLFGFTNDGEGLESGQQAAFRLQPKLHFDVEVD